MAKTIQNSTNNGSNRCVRIEFSNHVNEYSDVLLLLLVNTMTMMIRNKEDDDNEEELNNLMILTNDGWI